MFNWFKKYEDGEIDADTLKNAIEIENQNAKDRYQMKREAKDRGDIKSIVEVEDEVDENGWDGRW